MEPGGFEPPSASLLYSISFTRLPIISLTGEFLCAAKGGLCVFFSPSAYHTITAWPSSGGLTIHRLQELSHLRIGSQAAARRTVALSFATERLLTLFEADASTACVQLFSYYLRRILSVPFYRPRRFLSRRTKFFG